MPDGRRAHMNTITSTTKAATAAAIINDDGSSSKLPIVATRPSERAQIFTIRRRQIGLRQQVGTALQGALQPLLPAPERNLAVMPRKQHRRHRSLLPHR